MKRLMRAVGLAAILGFFIAGGIAPPVQAGDCNEVKLEVRAKNSWVEFSGFEIENGKMYRGDAVGEWYFDSAWSYIYHKKKRIFGHTYDYGPPQWKEVWFSADGVEDSKASKLCPLPGAQYGGLLYKIGEDGPVRWMGKECAFKADRSGKLYLGINDRHTADCLADNNGSLTVTIRKR